MSKESGSSGKRGLFSKVVRFVSSPTTHWADLDRPDNHSEISDSRLALKEMVERKRRNDFVRNREFDLLRKARRREVTNDDALGSTFPFPPSSQSVNSVGGRTRTLEKIDEIEKQMSSVWLKRKVDARASTAAALETGVREPAMSASDRAQEHAEFPPTVSADMHGWTVPPAQSSGAPLSAGVAGVVATAESAHPGEQATAPTSTDAVDSDRPADLQQEPAIEEAAIRFANGDASGAETGLLDLMNSSETQVQSLETWLTLFDLYRATGQQGKFDDAALEFANQFGRSAPQWDLGPLPTSQPMGLHPEVVGQVRRSASKALWVAPTVLGVQSVAALNASLARHAPPWLIDWRSLKSIEAAALPILTDALQQWAETSVRIHFVGGARLNQLLVECSPTDDRTVDPMWWTARLALLRVQGDMDEFDLVALKYCVTYEVSPPSWNDPVNEYFEQVEQIEESGSAEGAEGSETSAPDAPVDGFAPTHVLTELMPLQVEEPGGHEVLRVELSGELLGDAGSVINALKTTDIKAVEFHCSQLTRVDFGAAGTLLNWASEQQNAHIQIVFKHVNRLVASFFGVVGITEVAQVRLRKD